MVGMFREENIVATTALGKFLRKLRVDRDERLYDMANRVGVSSAFLSSIENGRKKPSSTLIRKLITEYNLNAKQQAELEEALSISQESIDISKFSPQKQRATLMFARKFDDLTDEQIEIIQKILKEDADHH